MRAPRKRAGHGWSFDGRTLTVHNPLTFKRRGGRKMIIAPNGTAPWAPAKPKPDDALIRARARAHRWRVAGGGAHRSADELAAAETIPPKMTWALAYAD